MIGALRVSYRRNLTAYQDGLARWLAQDGSAEAEAAGCEVAQLLILERARLTQKE